MARIAIIFAISALIFLAGCSSPGHTAVKRNNTRPDTESVKAFMSAIVDVPAEEKKKLIRETMPLLRQTSTEDIQVTQPTDAVSPGKISVNEKGAVQTNTGFMDAVDQLTQQLDPVVWLGVGLVLLGVVSFAFGFKIPGLSQSGSLILIGFGVGCFFVPTWVRSLGPYIGVVLAAIGAWFLYFWWYNRKLVLKGAAVAGGIEPPPVGVSKKAVAKASGSGALEIRAEDISPPIQKKT